MNYQRLLLALLLLLAPAVIQAQVPQPTPDAKAEAIVQHAIEVMGGSAYLNVKTTVGRGFFTSFIDGMSQIPARFVDYIAYPDHERTEFQWHPFDSNQCRRHWLGF